MWEKFCHALLFCFANIALSLSSLVQIHLTNNLVSSTTAVNGDCPIDWKITSVAALSSTAVFTAALRVLFSRD